MTKDQRVYLSDIRQSIEDIEQIHLAGIASEKAYHQAGLTLIRALERELSIIGEACRQLWKLDIRLSLSDELINFRHTLVHQYGATKPRTLWRVVRDDLPGLKAEVERLLNKAEEPPS